MDQDTAEHFYRWLTDHVDERDQHEVEQSIHRLLRAHPDLVTDHSWPEMRRMTEES